MVKSEDKIKINIKSKKILKSKNLNKKQKSDTD